MGGQVNRFEDLIAWQKARTLTQTIYRMTRQGSLARDFRLSGQMQRAAVSVMCNIAEGFERGNRAEFHYFLSIAKASCAELRSQLYVGFDVGHVSSPRFEKILLDAEELARILGGLRAAVGKQRRTHSRGP